MNISFALTETEFLAGVKSATRRRWKIVTAKKFKKGTQHTAWNRLPRVKNAYPLGIIRAKEDAFLQPLQDMTEADLKEEGGMCATVEEFISLVHGTPDEKLWVAKFEIVEIYQASCSRCNARYFDESGCDPCPCCGASYFKQIFPEVQS